MPADVIAEARAHRSARETQLAEHLAKVERDMQALDHEHRLAARERDTLAETAAKLQAREQELRNREETFRRKLEERIDDRLRDARREIDSVVDALKTKTDALAAEAERRMAPRLIPTGETGAARAEARAAIEAIGERLRDAMRKRPRQWPPRPNRAASQRSATACSSALSVSKAWCRRCTTARRRSTSAASGCAHGSMSCAC